MHPILTSYSSFPYFFHHNIVFSYVVFERVSSSVWKLNSIKSKRMRWKVKLWLTFSAFVACPRFFSYFASINIYIFRQLRWVRLHFADARVGCSQCRVNRGGMEKLRSLRPPRVRAPSADPRISSCTELHPHLLSVSLFPLLICMQIYISFILFFK